MHKLSITTFIFLFAFLNGVLYAQTPCVDGSSGGYPCNQVEFYANISNFNLAGQSGVEGADIWGWTDPDSGIEYALMCQTNGTVFIDISNPLSPKIIGRLPSHNNKSSTWRDVKVYNNFAFIVADNNSGHGMQVFDLKRLRNPGAGIQTFSADAKYDGVSSAHNVVINPNKALAYIVGARGAGNSCGAGGMHIVDISNPLSPTFAGCFDSDGYTHDGQVVTYNGPDTEYVGRQIAFNANENTITIADVDNPAATTLISKQGYSGSAYSHQGWLTEDHKYFLSNDELDERNGLVGKTRTLIWDVTDLDEPVLLDQHFGQYQVIDHNLYVNNNNVYQSNYSSGLRILDATDVNHGNLREVASFDTYPADNSLSFNGTWSNYPYFESGLIVVSDINNGFFVVKPNIKNIIESQPKLESCNGTVEINVGIGQNLEVDNYLWQIVNGNNISDISDNDIFNGSTTNSLTIDIDNSNLKGKSIRCKVTLLDGSYEFSNKTVKISDDAVAEFEVETVFPGSDGKRVTYTFKNLSKNAASYSWDFGDGSTISSAVNPTHVYQEKGTYIVSLTASNGCGDSTYTMELDLTTILSSKNPLTESLQIFPNPTSDIINISQSSSDIQLAEISIYDNTGKLVYRRKAEENMQIQTTSWKSGLYLMIIESSDHQKSIKKIIKN